MTEFYRWIKEIFQDTDGYYSSKRTIAFMSFLFLLAAGIVNLTNGIVITEFIFEGFMWIVLGGLGISTVEYIKDVVSKRPRASQTPSEPEVPTEITVNNEVNVRDE